MFTLQQSKGYTETYSIARLAYYENMDGLYHYGISVCAVSELAICWYITALSGPITSNGV